ncbi:hypothetical protein ABE28_003260 [Peribacillus muralis]|uniref:Peptidase S74 domain-containing protein n=1 Tax=Peribacillus muralis TaxID=264697 RepID=A0A1B3XJG4_9BACI|nr:hypothetical protein [Peribacillus muralis]AOH53358.1 hypothetical protein ABE28_003260 [Peribacillus muralis]
MNVLDNSPSTGYISWTGVNISYKGKTYKIADANTNLAYIYWKFSDPLSFYGSNTYPTLGDDDLLVFVNKSGTHLVVPNTTILDGSLFVPGSILANALAANSVTADKILAGAISAGKLSVNAVGADNIAANAVITDKLAAGAVDVGKIAAGAVTSNTIAANAIGANHIAANVITTNKMAIADFTNLVQVDSESFPNGNPTVDINNLRYFKIGPSAYSRLLLAQSIMQEFKVGDEYYFGGVGYKEAAITNVSVIIRYFYSDGSYANAGSAIVPLTASTAKFGIGVKITTDIDPVKTLSRIDISFEKDASTTGYFYMRQLEIRKRYAGELIVDGSITATQLKVDKLSALASDLGDMRGGTLNISNNNTNWIQGTTFVRMDKGQIWVTDKNPDDTDRKNADDLHIEDGALWMTRHGNDTYGEFGMSMAPHYFSYHQDDPVTGRTVYRTTLTAALFENPEITTETLNAKWANVNGLLEIVGALRIDGPIVMFGTGFFDMNNNQLQNVDRITFADAGGNEGLEWLGGNGWKIFESPDDASNAKGPLQFFTGTVRRATIGATGNFYITGNRFLIQNSGGSYEAEGTLVMKNASTGTELSIAGTSASPYIMSPALYSRTYSDAPNAFITSNGVLGRSTSASKYKIGIEKSKFDAHKILQLNPKTWYDKSATEAYADALTAELSGEEVDWDKVDIPEVKRVPGLIAEDVIEAGLPEYASYGPYKEDGTREVEGLMYDRLWTLLIPVVREQKEEIASLKDKIKQIETATEEKITTQQQTIENMAALMAKMEQRIAALEN